MSGASGGDLGQAAGLLFDGTRCIGCGACREACKERNGLPPTPFEPDTEDLSAKTLTVVNRRAGRYVRRLCMHCAEPTCASVCPVGAFEKTARGPVVYRADRCIGCRYCMQACPFEIPRYEWEKPLPLVKKCDLCADRVGLGLPTACAAVCPTGATTFGRRAALLDEARARIKKEPGRYVDHVYGEREVGGTSVLLLAGVAFDRLGYRTDLPTTPLPALSWRVMSQVPKFVVAAGVVLGGIHWITRRREDVAAAEGRETEDDR